MTPRATRRVARAVLFAFGMWVGGLPRSAAAPEPPGADGAVLEDAAETLVPSIPSVFPLEPGEIVSIPVQDVTRVAIGNPDVADITIPASTEILLQAKAPGLTNIILWDSQGQHVSSVVVIDRNPEKIEAQLQQMVRQMNLPGIEVKREGNRVFIAGEVVSPEELDRVEQMLSGFSGVSNLVHVAAPPAAAHPPLVTLTIQLIEMNRDVTDRFGVDWKDSLTFTETTFGALGPRDVSYAARLGDAFRLGALSRTGFDPVLNLLISDGKARVLAEPKLVAASGKEATAFLGVEVPIITTTSVSSGTVSQSIEFKNTGVELQFRPTVLEDERSIQTGISAKVSSIDRSVAITVSGVSVPGFKVRQTETEIITESGQSVLIAGLLQDQESKTLSQMPGASRIPVLGNLFRSNEFVSGQTELVMVVTPELSADAGSSADRTFALEQALASAETADAVSDPAQRYALQIQERIAAALRYPSRERELGVSGRVKLRLHLFRDGTLERVAVTESSGVQSLDDEALMAAQNQSPYPPFPFELAQTELWLELPVLFHP